MATIKANDYLLKHGHIKEIKRGRRSVENTSILNQAFAEGVKFSDYTPSESTNEAGETVIKNVAKPQTMVTEPFIRYPGPSGNEYAANSIWKVTVDGNEVKRSDNDIKNDWGGLRNTCNNCGWSLVGHQCHTPVISIDGKSVPVAVERR